MALAFALPCQGTAEPLFIPDEAAQQADAMIAAVKRDKTVDAWVGCIVDRANDLVPTLSPDFAIKVALSDCWNQENAVLSFMLNPPFSIEMPRAVKTIANMRDEFRLKLLKEFEQARQRRPPAPSSPTSAPAPNSLAWLMARPWYHVDGPVSDAQFERDKNNCALAAQRAPVGAASPSVKYLAVFTTCLRAEGYEPEPESKSGSTPALRRGS